MKELYVTFLLKRKLATAVCTAVIGGAFAPAAMAWYCPPPEPTGKNCNAGRGNGSEGCDPGNSSTNPNGTTGQNQGGDEGGPIRGGTGAP
jgi:hypothetical protein